MNINQLAHRAPVINSDTFQSYSKVGAWRGMDVCVYESVNFRFHPIAQDGKILIKVEFNTFDKHRKELVFFDQFNEIELQDYHTDFRQVVKDNCALLYHELLQQIRKDVRASVNLYLPNWDKLRIFNIQEDGLLTKSVNANAATD